MDAKASILELTIGGQDVILKQSPTILNSNRAEGTTGAVLWEISPLFAQWVRWSTNPLFQQKILTRTSTVLELGCGISGLVGLALAPYVGKVILTDQAYLLKSIRQNLAENLLTTRPGLSHLSKRKDSSGVSCEPDKQAAIEVMELDWEMSSISSMPVHLGNAHGLDAIIACDCVYNEVLIEPLVRTCSELCELRDRTSQKAPTLCIVAQQLRSPSVFQTWLESFHQDFKVWRLPDDLLTEGLRSGSGYVVHLGFLRDT